MKTSKFLKEMGRVLIEHPEVWTKGSDGRLENSRRVDATHPKAVRFCARGFVIRAEVEGLISYEQGFKARRAVEHALGEAGHVRSLAIVNDAYTNGREKIATACKAAAKILRGRGE